MICPGPFRTAGIININSISICLRKPSDFAVIHGIDLHVWLVSVLIEECAEELSLQHGRNQGN